MEEEPDACADQMLTQVAALVGVDLGARIIEVVVFDKGAEVGVKEVVCTCDHLPRQVRVTCSAASVNWDTTGYRIYDLDPRGFGVVNADAGAGIRLEPAIFGRNSQNEVKHKRACVNPGGRVALCYNVIKWIPQGEIGAATETIIEEIAFHRWTNYARAKDITELNAAEKSDVIFWIYVEAVSKERIIRIVLCKRSVVTAVLIDVCPHVDRTVEAESIHWRRRRRDLFVFGSRPRSKRGRKKSCQRNSGE